MKQDPARVYDDVCDFLGIEHWRPRAEVERNVGKYEPLDGKMRAMLHEFFRPHNLELYQLLGRDYGWHR